MQDIISHSPTDTQTLAHEFTGSLQGGDILCLNGDLGSGKTTFTQGLLGSFGAQKPFVSPTFLIMKEYDIQKTSSNIDRIYHIDAYRISSDDMRLLGWEEMLENKSALIIIEWPERIKDIIPSSATWMDFKWMDENTRSITKKETFL